MPLNSGTPIPGAPSEAWTPDFLAPPGVWTSLLGTGHDRAANTTTLTASASFSHSYLRHQLIREFHFWALSPLRLENAWPAFSGTFRVDRPLPSFSHFWLMVILPALRARGSQRLPRNLGIPGFPLFFFLFLAGLNLQAPSSAVRTAEQRVIDPITGLSPLAWPGFPVLG